MMKQIVKNTFGGINRTIWMLTLSMFINRLGSMVMLFMGLYSKVYLGFTLAQTGIVMSMLGLGSLLGAFIGGYLLSLWTYKQVMIFTLLMSGLLLLLFPQFKDFHVVCFFSFLYTFLGDAFRPANFKAIAELTSPENYTKAIGLNRLAINLGFMFSPVIGSILIQFKYSYIYYFDGITSLMSSLLILGTVKVVTQSKTTQEKSKSENEISPYKDYQYLIYLASIFLYALCFFQLFSSFPLYLKSEYSMSEKQIGVFMAINGFGVFIVEMFLIGILQKRWKMRKWITLGLILLGLSFLLIPIFHTIQYMLVVILIFTISEMLCMPFFATISMNRARGKNLGLYMGLNSMMWSLALIFAPLCSTQIVDNYGYNMHWVFFGLILILQSILITIFRKMPDEASQIN